MDNGLESRVGVRKGMQMSAVDRCRSMLNVEN
jgi:hypothetical protein